MNKKVLKLLFEQVLNKYIDLNNYPSLKKIVDRFHSKGFIDDTDFNVLLIPTKNTIQNIDNIDYVLNHNFRGEYKYGNDSNTRLYNLAVKIYGTLLDNGRHDKNSGYKLSASDEQLYLDAFSDYRKLLKNVNQYYEELKNKRKQQADLEKQQNDNNTDNSKINSNVDNNDNILPKVDYKYIEKSKFLKDFTKILIDNKLYGIDDNILLSFKYPTEENEKYYNAIMNNDMSLPVGNSSKPLTVYSLWKGLKYQCQQSVNRYSKFMQLSKTGSDYNFNPFNKKNKELTDVESVTLKNIPKKSLIELSYYKYDTNNRIISNKQETEIYEFYELTKNYQFVNIGNRNEFFTFVQGSVPVYLEVNKKYPVSFNQLNDFNGYLYITNIRINNFQTSSAFKNCNAIDELKQILKTIRESN